MAELKEVGRQLSEHWRPFDPLAPPPCIALATSSYREKPDVWLAPSKSKIVQIRAAEIVTSARWERQGEEQGEGQGEGQAGNLNNGYSRPKQRSFPKQFT